MGNLIQLGTTFREIESRKIREQDLLPRLNPTARSANDGCTVPQVPSPLLAPLRLVCERQSERRLVLEDLPARVLLENEWVAIEMIDLSERGFSFEVEGDRAPSVSVGARLVFALRVPELREFTIYGRVQWRRAQAEVGQVRCGVEIIEVHGPGGGLSVTELLNLLARELKMIRAQSQPQTKIAA